MNAKTILLPIAQKILRILLMTVGSALSGWLVTRHLISEGDQGNILGLCGDAAPAVLGALPGVWWDLYAWLNKFRFVVNIETALHLPITGQPAQSTVTQASLNTILADSSVSTPPGAPSNPQ